MQVIAQFAAIMSSTRDTKSGDSFPNPAARLAEILGAANFDAFIFLPIGCIFPTIGTRFYVILLVKTIGPIVPVVVLWTWARVGCRGRSEMPQRFQDAAHMTILWVQLVLTSVSTTIVQTFQCTVFDDDDAYLTVELTVSCSSRQYLGIWRPYALCFLLVYPLGVPTMLFALLATNRTEIRFLMQAIATEDVQDGAMDVQQLEVNISRRRSKVRKRSMIKKIREHSQRLKWAVRCAGRPCTTFPAHPLDLCRVTPDTASVNSRILIQVTTRIWRYGCQRKHSPNDSV